MSVQCSRVLWMLLLRRVVINGFQTASFFFLFHILHNFVTRYFFKEAIQHAVFFFCSRRFNFCAVRAKALRAPTRVNFRVRNGPSIKTNSLMKKIDNHLF